jgi:hypothetical protein
MQDHKHQRKNEMQDQTSDADLKSTNSEGDPPLFRTWTHWYILVIAFLLLLIILFYQFTKTFA